MKDPRKSGKGNFTKGIFGRLIKSSISIFVLSAFVLGIVFSVKQLSEINAKSLVSFASPYLAKLGIEEQMVGDVAGIVFKQGVNSESKSTMDVVAETSTVMPEVSSNVEAEVVYTMALFADIHLANDKEQYIENKEFLKTALNKAKDLEVNDLVILGDITNWGVLEDLREAKKIIADSQLSYYAIPGDRDLAQSVGTENFLNVFKSDHYAFERNGTKFVILDNGANYTTIPQDTLEWFTEEIADADFVVLSQPLYTDGLLMFNYLYMGNTNNSEVEGMKEKQMEVLSQRNLLLDIIRSSDVKAVIAGDHHKSSSIVDKVDTDLMHYVVGAISGTVSEYSQSVIQSQRFSMLKIYDNDTYMIEDIIL